VDPADIAAASASALDNLARRRKADVAFIAAAVVVTVIV